MSQTMIWSVDFSSFFNHFIQFEITYEYFRRLHGRSRVFVCGLSSPVVGLHSVGRRTSGRFCRVCLGTQGFLRPPQTFSKTMYGTRPCSLVQAITRHMCPDPHLGSWNCLPHQAHITPSEPMSSIDQQGSSLSSSPTFPSPFSPL